MQGAVIARGPGRIRRWVQSQLALPVTYCSELMTVAYGGTANEAGLDGHVIAPAKLQAIAERNEK